MKTRYSTLLAIVFLALGSCTSNNENQNEVVQSSGDTVSSIAQDPAAVDPGFTSLFNGENLDGWEVKAVQEDQHWDFWSVKDGAIVVNSMGHKEHDYS